MPPPPPPPPPPPQTDRGWAWVVLGASMGCNFLNGVLCYFVGVVHTGLLHTFQASVTTTAWVGSLYAANMSLSAPLAALVISRFGCRVCCISGGLLCFGGFLASAFVPSIAWLFLTYGMMAGVGLGFTYSPSVITIGFYFDKYRGMATGLAVSLAAIGILSGSLITQTLIDNYSVSGAFLILAALSLHFCFFGAFLRPTQYELEGSDTHIRADSSGGEGGQREHQLAASSWWGSKASRLSLALHGIEIRAVSQASSIHRVHESGGGGGGGVGGSRLGGFGSVTSLLRRAQTNRRRQNLGSSSLAASVVSGDIFPAKHHCGADGDGAGSMCSCSVLVPASSDIVQVECEEVVSPDDLELELEKTLFSSRRTDSPFKSRSPHPPADIEHADHAVDGGHTIANGILCTTPTPIENIPGIILEHMRGEETTSLVSHLHLNHNHNHHHHHYHHHNGSVAGDTSTNISLHEEDYSGGSGGGGGGGHHHRLFHNSRNGLHSPPYLHNSNSEMDVRSFTSSRENVKQEQPGKPRPGKESRTLRETRLLKAADSYMAVLTHSAFMCHCASTLAANIHISGVYLHLPEYVLTKGTSVNQAAALFVAVGISSLLSRLATGFASMDPRIECLTLNIGMMGLCGLGTIAFPFYADTYTGQLVFSALFGLYTGGQYALLSVMSVHFMGVRLLPTALGILAFFMGVGYVSGPPLAAFIVDSGGTYQDSFIFLGVGMTLGSFLDMAAVYFSEPTTTTTMMTKGEEEEEGEGEEEQEDRQETGGERRDKEEERGEDEVVEVEVASMSREWLGSTIVICYQDTTSSQAHVQGDPGSLRSVRSLFAP